MRERVLLVGVLVLVALSGCSSDDGGAAPTTSPTRPPSVVELYNKEVKCVGPDYLNGRPSETIEEEITVEDGFDEMTVSFHVSGFGQYRAAVIYNDNASYTWSQNGTVNTQCGSHGAHTGGDVRKVLDGDYKVRVTYTGQIALHFGIIVRNTTATATTATTTHSGH